MELFKDLLPLLGVLLGAGLSGISQLYKERQERKQAIAKALTDLLEVRHHIAGINEVLNAFKQKYDIPAEVEALLHSTIEQASPIDPDLHKRYESAVSILSGYDPMLAFSLRSRSTAPHFINSVQSLGSTHGVNGQELGMISSALLSTILVPTMNQAVLKLAAAHTWATRRKVAKYIKKSSGLPVEANVMFAQLEGRIKTQSDASNPKQS